MAHVVAPMYLRKMFKTILMTPIAPTFELCEIFISRVGRVTPALQNVGWVDKPSIHDIITSIAGFRTSTQPTGF